MTECKTKSSDQQLLDKLHDVLQKQTRMARKGNLTAVEDLSQKAGDIVKELEQVTDLEHIRKTDNCKTLESVYRQLALILASQKYSIEQQIQQIRDGRKTLKAYKISH